MPAIAARAFKVRCRTSGTLRSWIIFDMFVAYFHVLHMLNEVSISTSHSLTRPLKVGVRCVHQRNWDYLAIVRMARIMPAVHTTVRTECPKNAAIVIHHQIRILPVTAQLDTGAMIARKLCIQPGPVVHVEADGFPIGREV